MSKILDAVNWAEGIALDNSHGYSQINRWGPDYDCSSLVIAALERSGIPARSSGAGNTWTMPPVLLALGFTNVIGKVDINSGSGLIRGDILWSQKHTAFYCGNGKLVHASIDEDGTIVGKKPGDQTGREICIRSYYNKPWTAVYRLSDQEGTTEKMITVQLPMLKRGSTGECVRTAQILLNANKFDCGAVDSEFGPKTEAAVKSFQEVNGHDEIDGIIGQNTWNDLLK